MKEPPIQLDGERTRTPAVIAVESIIDTHRVVKQSKEEYDGSVRIRVLLQQNAAGIGDTFPMQRAVNRRMTMCAACVDFGDGEVQSGMIARTLMREG